MFVDVLQVCVQVLVQVLVQVWVQVLDVASPLSSVSADLIVASNPS